MKRTLSIIALFAVATATGLRADTFGFDLLPANASGAAQFANSYTQGRFTFSYAINSPETDPATGDPIAGTTRWRPDTSPGTPQVSVANPLLFGRGVAPSGANAVNGLDQPIYLNFGSQTIFSFGATLDRSRITGNASPIQDVLFLNAAGGLVKTQPLDLSVPANSFDATGLNGVSSVVLPAGKFYDDIRFTAVPEPGTIALAVLGTLGFGLRRLRQRF